MDETNLDEVKRLNQCLTALLEDAQTGMFTWCIAYCETLQKLGELGKKNPSDQYKGNL